MSAEKRRIHGGLILASGLFAASLSVLILGASRGQAKDAGLPGSTATAFTLADTAGKAVDVARVDNQPLILIVTRRDFSAAGVFGTELRQVVDTFSHDSAVRVIGVQVPIDTGLLDDNIHTPGVLQTACPSLSALTDADGTVARAYRVSDAPTAFVIDDKHVIRGRFPLDRDGAAVAIAEAVTALRPAQGNLPGDTFMD